MLILDLGVFHRHSRETTMREAAGWTIVWCLLALVFDAFLWYGYKEDGPQAAQEFITGYLVEWSLSMDNVFVFAVIFGFFKVPRKYQHRVLFWGILGAVFMRLAFILLGAAVLAHWTWILPVLGAFLVYTGYKLASKGETDVHPYKNIVLRVARRLMRVSRGEHGKAFFARENGKWAVTPLFLVLLVVETTDVVFAVDSVPAILGLVDPQKPYFSFVVFTSNVFAILGLRALYFLLAGMMNMFKYLAYGLSAILIFVGLKMIGEYAAEKLKWVEAEHHVVPPWLSLVVILSLLGLSIGASILSLRIEARRARKAPLAPPQPKDEPTPEPEPAAARDSSAGHSSD